MTEWEGAPGIFEKQKNEYLAKAEIFMVLQSFIQEIFIEHLLWACIGK